MAPRKNKKNPPAPTNPPTLPATPSTPLSTSETNRKPSPPTAPQKPTSFPQEAVSLPMRHPHPQPPPANQQAQPTTPIRQASHTKGSNPSTPKPLGTTPKHGAGSATPRPIPAEIRRTSSSITEEPPVGPQAPPFKVLLPAPDLRQTPGSTGFTVLQALSTPLPALKMANDFNPKLGNHKSSALVDAADPPRFWSEVRAEHYLALADKYLAKAGVQSKLSLQYASSLDPTFRVRREADVVTYAATHLTNSANIAIDAFFSGAVETVSEMEVNQCRPDYIWRAAGSKGANQAFAILEMKITGRAASYRPETYFQYDDGSEYKAMKQLATYAHSKQFDSRYAALFDGSHLFLGIFSEGPTPVPLLKGTLLPCHDDQGRHARKALLGWLIEAKLEKQQGRNCAVSRSGGGKARPRK
ncbi:hypothetical protein F5144DRAFT_606995 [Chaetomium tenue]|uniref:Uncharacterized protein n=1 Tax=Chaetomium tenue TaxID=1854479 RepID=A0ACB7NW25_9PEZI|nr:hypothetical protein F5144DRAFT_606995 [Chaetomium globosum]